MICQTGTISRSSPPGCRRLVRTKVNIKKGNDRLRRKLRVSPQKIATDLDISRISVWRILKNDMRLRPYKKITEPLLSHDQRVKRKKFENWLRTYFRKEDTMKILFSDEKYFDIDDVYDSQNDRVWAANRADADEKGSVKQRRNSHKK